MMTLNDMELKILLRTPGGHYKCKHINMIFKVLIFLDQVKCHQEKLI